MVNIKLKRIVNKKRASKKEKVKKQASKEEKIEGKMKSRKRKRKKSLIGNRKKNILKVKCSMNDI